ncbi:MAG: nucleotidyltransferase domain-containing protein [Bacteroidia bacterium]
MALPAPLPPPLEHVLEVLYRERGWEVYIFGSWARGEENPTDIDIALSGSPPPSEGELAELREQLEELPIPYRVDVVCYQRASASLQEAIQREGILWKPKGG